MKNYFVLIPDSDEFSIISKTLFLRSITAKDITLSHPHIAGMTRMSVTMTPVVSVGVPKYQIHFIQSGVGKIATCQTLKKLSRSRIIKGASIDHIIMAGSACGKTPGIYRIERVYQEIDLRPAGRSLGDSPDVPLYYDSTDGNSKDYTFSDIPLADSLTVERFCTEFPDLSEYFDISDTTVVDMEDYAFIALLQDDYIPYTILRVVTDEGNYDSWTKSLEAGITELLNLLMSHLRG